MIPQLTNIQAWIGIILIALSTAEALLVTFRRKKIRFWGFILKFLCNVTWISYHYYYNKDLNLMILFGVYALISMVGIINNFRKE